MPPSVVLLGPVVLATVLPGPSMLLALDHGLRFGARKASATALGNLAATALQTTLVLAGLQAVALASSRLLTLVRLGGAGYLVWLGLGLLRSSRRGETGSARSEVAASGTGRFRQAVLVTLGNPSALLFFAAFFPPFLERGLGRAWLLVHLVLPILAITFLSMMLYARFGAGLVRLLAGPRWARASRLVLGAAFLAMGAWMLR
jgi:threonine/homoserine/homoserine lactone efflux protein